MDEILQKPLSWLQQHPKNKTVFESRPKEFEGILASIEEQGVQEPIIAKEDGVILSGHLRYFALTHLAKKRAEAAGVEPDLTLVMVPVRIHPSFESEYDEFCYLVEANLQRRHLTPDELAVAYKVLREARTKDDHKPKEAKEKGAPKGRRTSAREQSAGSLNISVRSGDAHEAIFTTEGIPEEVKTLARNKEVSIVKAGEAVKAHLVDGKVVDPDKLVEEVKALATKTAKPLQAKLRGEADVTALVTLVTAPKTSAMHEQIQDVERTLATVLSSGVMVDEAATQEALVAVFNRIQSFLSGMGWNADEGPVPPSKESKWEEPTPFFCSECGEPQFSCPSGMFCKNGHGGAASLNAQPLNVAQEPMGLAPVNPLDQSPGLPTGLTTTTPLPGFTIVTPKVKPEEIDLDEMLRTL